MTARWAAALGVFAVLAAAIATPVGDADAQTSMSVSTTALPAGGQGEAYSATLSAVGGEGVVTWAIASGALPTGLSLSGAGAISGIPTGSGASTFTVSARDSSSPRRTATADLRIEVRDARAISVTSDPTVSATRGKPFSSPLAATGGVAPYTWRTTEQPPGGINLSSSGVLSGTPAESGTFAITVVVSDSATPTPNQRSAKLALVVGTGEPLAIVTSSIGPFALGRDANSGLAATGGVTPATWSVVVGSLPPGLGLDAATGRVSGVPKQAGTFSVTVAATDSTVPLPQNAIKA